MSHFLSKSLIAKDGPNGTAFYNALAIPSAVKGQLLHALLVDGRPSVVPSLKELKLTYGNKVPDSSRYEAKNVYDDILCPDDFLPETERWAAMDAAFLELNDPEKSLKERLDLWDKCEPGFIMTVVGGIDTPTCGIGCIANPVCTQRMAEDGALGAPNWPEIFDQVTCDEMVGAGVTATHCIVGSLAHHTWSLIGKSREQFIEGLRPVMITDGKAIGCKPLNGDVFQLLFIPFQGEAPVGFFVDSATTYDQYVDGLKNNRVYFNFIRLLKKFKPTFKTWFEAVNKNPGAFKVSLKSALELYGKFPSTATPEGIGIENPNLLGPLLIQQNRFLRAALDDIILRAPFGLNEADAPARCQYALWRDRVEECYPIALGGTRPISRQAFLEQLLPPDGGWPTPFDSWSTICALDSPLKLPQAYSVYKPVAIPIDAATSAEWVPRRLEPPQSSDPLAAFRKLKAARKTRAQQTSSPTLDTTHDSSLETPAASQTQRPVAAKVTPDEASPTDVSVGTQQMRQLFSGDEMGPPAPSQHPSTVQKRDRTTWNPFDQSRQNGTDAASAIEFMDTPPPKRAKQVDFLQQGSEQIAGRQLASAFGEADPFSPPRHGTGYDSLFGGGGMGQFHQPIIFHTNGKVTAPRHATMEACKITSAANRAKCNPIFLQLSLFMVYPLPSGCRTYLRERDCEMLSNNVMIVKPPSPYGVGFLSGFDYANNGINAAHSLATAMEYRWNNDQSLGMVSLPTHEWTSTLTPAFVKRGFSPILWRVRTDQAPPSTTEEKHSLLSFLPFVDPTYSSECLPRGGIPLPKMHQLMRFIYYFYSMPSCKKGVNGIGYDDYNFKESIFGSKLLLMCRVLLNSAMVQPWEADQETCTLNFMGDLSELFEILQDFIKHRMGEDVLTCGIDNGVIQGYDERELVVVPAIMTPDPVTQSTNHFGDRMHEYRTRMQNTWIRGGRYKVNQADSRWSHSVNHQWLAPSSNTRSNAGATGNKNATVDKENPPKGPGKPKPSGGLQGAATPFHNSSPMFEYVGTQKHADVTALASYLTSKVPKGTWPHVEIDGKKHTFCLQSAFVGFCDCTDTRSCKTIRPFKGFAKNRLHVDLKESKWLSTNFEESKWRSVVTFLKSNTDLLKPTEAFKKLTPSADWQS